MHILLCIYSVLFSSKALFALKGAIHEPAAVYNSHTEHHNPLNSSTTLPSREQALLIKLFLIPWCKDLLCHPEWVKTLSL